jgi:hypothetical protein
MNTALIRKQTPEERELEKKRGELALLEAELAERELERATLQAELHAFERRYLRIVGVRYAELDEINAQIAEAQSRLHPNNKVAQEEAKQTREQAQESAGAAADAQSVEPHQKFRPSDDLKKLYRDLARKLHPDLATDPQERERRHQLMVEVNRAYEAGNDVRLQTILRDWQRSPESVKDEGVGAELIRLIRQIAQAEERIAAIDEEIAELQTSELAELKARVERAENAGHDLLAVMAADLDQQIISAKLKGYDMLVKLLRMLDAKGEVGCYG